MHILIIHTLIIHKVHRAMPFWFSCSSTRNCIAYANKGNIVNKDSRIIATFGFHKFLRSKGKIFGSAKCNEEFLPVLACPFESGSLHCSLHRNVLTLQVVLCNSSHTSRRKSWPPISLNKFCFSSKHWKLCLTLTLLKRSASTSFSATKTLKMIHTKIRQPSLFAATKYGPSWSVLGIWFFVPTIPCKRNNNARGNKHIIQMRKHKGSMSSEGCRKAFHTVWMLPCVVSQPNINQEVFVNYPKSFVKTWPLMHTLDTHIKIA